MSIESSFDQLIAALEEQQDKVECHVMDLCAKLAEGGHHKDTLVGARSLVDRTQMAMNYVRVLEILGAFRGAFAELVGMTSEQEELLRKLGFKF